ncbi:MAG: hypothetical protein M1824_001231 [Vezdaea acicularis]|nr:MAG: hypothetical protein M1824_001231 [Vezdaea acicularis]
MANVATSTATPVATETPQTAEVKRNEVVDTAADDSSPPKRESAPLESDDNERIINARITRDFGPRDILSHMLQTIGIIAAIIFGIWAVRSYNVSVTQLDASNAANSAANDASASSYSQMLSAARTQSMAYEQNLIANQLALVQLCAIRTPHLEI